MRFLPLLFILCIWSLDQAAATTAAILTPLDHGARGDGVHDDTRALQACFNRIKKFSDEVTVDLGQGTYRISGAYSDPTLPNTILVLGNNGGRPRKLRLVGQNAKIVVNQKTDASILLILCSSNSISVEGITFVREERCTAQDSFQGGGGIYLTDTAVSRQIDKITFRSCTFVNCHRAITASSRYADLSVADLTKPYYLSAGNLKQLVVDNCKFLYPYGSNSTSRTGGGQALYSGPWSATSIIRNCTFDGAASGVGSVPNGLPKDGFIFGEPLNLIATGNSLRNFWVEGIACDFQRGSIRSLKPFRLPAAGEQITILTDRGAQLNALRPGHHLVFPGAGEFIVVEAKPSGSVTFRLFKPYAPANAPISPGRFLLPVQSTGVATCADNKIHGSPVKGFIPSPTSFGAADPGIRINDMQADISQNVILGSKGVMLTAPPPNDPAWRPSFNSSIDGNTVVLLNASRTIDGQPARASIGIALYQPGVVCHGNTVTLPSSKNATGYGIVVPNPNITISGDEILNTGGDERAGVGPDACGIEIGNIGTPRQGRGVRIINTNFSNIPIAILSNTAPIEKASGNTFTNVATWFRGPGTFPQSVLK